MNNKSKEQIAQLRADGESYTRIAEILDLSINTIKSVCRRNNLSIASNEAVIKRADSNCKQCEKPLIHSIGKKRKSFCSDQCRMAWWKVNRGLVKHIACPETRCDLCHKSFHSYGNKLRKYCSHSCYIQARFGRASS
jgi:endogenous inhibitor of DNA gyrase (YacG/DUF329 family)